jgi:hypothetical protein
VNEPPTDVLPAVPRFVPLMTGQANETTRPADSAPARLAQHQTEPIHAAPAGQAKPSVPPVAAPPARLQPRFVPIQPSKAMHAHWWLRNTLLAVAVALLMLLCVLVGVILVETVTFGVVVLT